MAVDTDAVSEATAKVTGLLVPVALSKLSVTPLIAPVTVFVALVTGTPSTVSDASAPWAACEKPKLGSLTVKGVLPSVLVMDR